VSLARRTVLRGLGVALAVPWLERFAPARSESAPLRLVFVYAPNGVNRALWTPAREGELTHLPPTLEPLAPFVDSLTVLSGLAHAKAEANGDGPGDHARAAATFLTGAQAYKTPGENLHAGISIDQLVAQAIGHRTRLSSLELGIEGGRQAGACDSGYACVYSSTLSWAGPRTPLSHESSPRAVFERLIGDFAQPREVRERRAAELASVLDFVSEDARSLRARLGRADATRLEEYFEALRALERRLERLESEDAPAPGLAEPARVRPATRREHIALQFELLALALRQDLTRVATFMLANEGSNHSHADVGVAEGHHELSHHGGDADKLKRVGQIDRFHVEGLAAFLALLDAAREGDASLLDRCLVVFGSGIGDGNRHDHADLPLLLAGGGAGTVRSGLHVRVPPGTPATNLFLALAARMGVVATSLGDSTGVLNLG
jgi:hypothetical protein